MHNLIKIIVISICNILFLGCHAQSKNKKNFNIDKLFNIYIQNNPQINQKDTYLEIGIERDHNRSGFNIYLRSFCKICPYNSSNNSLFVNYKGFDVIIIYDNDENKKYILENLKNFSFSKKFDLRSPDPNLLLNFKYWMLSYDENGKCYYICADPEIITAIKNELNIDTDVDSCN